MLNVILYYVWFLKKIYLESIIYTNYLTNETSFCQLKSVVLCLTGEMVKSL